MLFRFGAAAVIAGTFAVTAPAQAASVSFTGLTGSANPLTVGTGANAVTFNSASGPGTFTVGSTAGLFKGFSTGLGDFGSFSGDPLTITFATPVTTPLTLSFGIEDAFGTFGGDSLTLTTNLGATASATGVLNSLSFPEPEGTATINSPGFTTLTVTSANPFAIGSLSTAVPEPFTLSILAVGLAGIATARRRRV